MNFFGLAAAFALQGEPAALAGTIRDLASGSAIPGAAVSLPELGRTATTDGSGHYRFPNVPIGPQHIAVRAIGYTPRTVHALVPPSGTLDISVALTRQATELPPVVVRGAVTPPAGAPLPGDEAQDHSVSRLAMTNHPLLAEPDPLEALRGGGVFLRPESPSGVHIRGAAADQTGYLLDGVPVLSPYHAAGLFGGWNPDVLDRVQVRPSAGAADPSDALGGVVSGTSRAPDRSLVTEGSIGTSQARVSLSGPLGARSGFVAGWRSGFPGTFAPRGEGTYLRGASGDWFAKIEGAGLGGRWRILGFGLDDELGVGSTASASVTVPQNGFEWSSRSFGAEWRRSFGRASLRWTGWNARSEAHAEWNGQRGPLTLGSLRSDLGQIATIERSDRSGVTSLGVRIGRTRTSYGVDSGRGESAASFRASPMVSAVLNRSQQLTPHLRVEAGAVLAAGAGGTRVGPQARAIWSPARPLTATASFNRFHQYAQSLRNPESVAGAVFPVDLFVGSGIGGVPVARSDLAVLAVDSRLGPGIRLGLQGYHRRSTGLALAAPVGGQPFSTGSFVIGSGKASGVAVDASIERARFSAIASYAFQRARLSTSGLAYSPDQGPTHTFDAGVVVFPSASSSVRLAVSAAGGRVGTAVLGGLEWEACNLTDRGCEFGGSPETPTGSLGRTTLPGYLRVDLGFRTHRHLRLGRHGGSVALFGTLSNLLGKRNLLTYSIDPTTGQRTGIEMRPRAPVVVGLDWRF